MQCFIYKGKKKPDYYLFVNELTLSADQAMAQSDPAEVMRLLNEQGFYIQIPKDTSNGVLA